MMYAPVKLSRIAC